MNKSTEKKRFGSYDARENIIKRDGYQCTSCLISRDAHRDKYKCDLNVDHIDGNGRFFNNPNNHPDNLITLCKKCHGSKDGKRADYSKRRSYKGENHPCAKIKDADIENLHIMKKSGITQVEIAKRIGLSQSSVSRLLMRDN